jgi:hypothetical protein
VGKFDPNGQMLRQHKWSTNASIQYSYDYYDNSPMDRVLQGLFSKLDNINARAYEEQIQGIIIDEAKSYKNDYNSLKHFRIPCNSRIFSFRILFCFNVKFE